MPESVPSGVLCVVWPDIDVIHSRLHIGSAHISVMLLRMKVGLVTPQYVLQIETNSYCYTYVRRHKQAEV